MSLSARAPSIGSFPALLLLWLLAGAARPRKFVIRSVNPFLELYQADIFGNILGQEARFKPENFGLFTLRQPGEGEGAKYLIFLKYTSSERSFLVKKCEDDVNDSTIRGDDLIFFSSPKIPFLIYFGSSKKHSPLFDMRVETLGEIEKALNEHLGAHPVKIFQEMNMMKFSESSVSFLDMGHIYSSNQEIVHSAVERSFASPEAPAANFQFDNSQEKNLRQIVTLARQFREEVQSIVDEYTAVATPGNSLAALEDPQTEGLRQLRAMREDMLRELGGIVSERRTSYLFRLFLYKNLVKAKRVANYILEKFVLKANSNILVSPFLFKRPTVYFPDRIEVPIEEFVDVYAAELVRKAVPQEQLDTPPGGLLMVLEAAFKKMAARYAETLQKLGAQPKQSFAAEFEKSLALKARQLNRLGYMVTKNMKTRTRNAMRDYLMGIYNNPRFEKANIFRETSSLINIYALNEVYMIFSPGRSVNSGFAVDVQVFDVVEDQSAREERALNALI